MPTIPMHHSSHTTDTLVIGAGQAGLAASRCLSDRNVEHLVLDRGRIAERWRSERWDSLRLLTPNWMTRLPGYEYEGPEPDGFMTAGETAVFFEEYARVSAAPVIQHVEVVDLSGSDDCFTAITTAGPFTCRNVIIATGWCDKPAVPTFVQQLPAHVDRVTPAAYRNPSQLAPGPVLVVGASATGVQLAHEIAASGRDVTLAVGSHQRMPRCYRGMDTYWWLDRLGFFDRTIDEVRDPLAARAEPSAQLVGDPDRRTLDLQALSDSGVRLVGRLVGCDTDRFYFDDSLAQNLARADERLNQLLDRIDAAIAVNGLAGEVLAPHRLPPVRLPADPIPTELRGAEVRTVVWATGYRRSYTWLRLPVLDRQGEIIQRRGITPVPGVYVLGQRFQHYRNSSFIDGVGRDAAFVVDHIDSRRASSRSQFAQLGDRS